MHMRFKSLGVLVAAAAALTDASARADAPGCAALGAVNSAFPSRLLIGTGSSAPDDMAATWAQQSGTKFDVLWMYLSGQGGNNWYNNWGSGAGDGSFIDSALTTIAGYGFIPGFHLYNMGYGHDSGDSGILTELQNSTWTKAYFTEFKVFMQKAKNFGKPVVIVLEGDSFGFLENLTKNDPTVMAAVASTGLPELANLPNTVAGFGMAFLAIRKSVGAYNVAMGPDTPYYAANGDIMNFAPTDMENLQPHVDFQWIFFKPFVGPNMTGDRFDFNASAMSAADCASYTDGRPCWDPSDNASITAPSINRYVQWLHLYNLTSGVRWFLHQVPLGNSQHRNVAYDGTARSGYKDNKVEYLFQYESPASTAIRDQHLANFANAGVVAMLFGNSDDGDTPWTDLWTDNQPFFKTHVAAVNNNGGFVIAPGTGPGCGDGGPIGSSGGGSGAGSGSGSGGGSGSGSGAGSSGSGSGGRHGSSSGGPSSGSGSGAGGSAGGTTAGASSGGPGGPASGSSAGGAGSDGGTSSSAKSDASLNGEAPGSNGGCGCSAAGAAQASGGAIALVLVPLALRLRRRHSSAMRACETNSN
jgi:MYXO-CTERM domain-containing protein